MEKRFISNIPTIRDFLNESDANWRNSVYIECHQKCALACGDNKDFLYTPGVNGVPIIVPVCDMELLFGRRLDKTECLTEFSVPRFSSLYGNWLEHCAPIKEKCRLMQAVQALNAPEDW